MERKYTIKRQCDLANENGDTIGRAFHDLTKTTTFGNLVVPDFFTIVMPGGPDGQPRLRIEADLVDGEMRCTEVKITSKPGGRGVQYKDLKMVHPDQMVDSVMKILSTEATVVDENNVAVNWDGRDLSAPMKRQAETLLPAGKGRPAMGDEDYEAVARVYRDHGNKVEPVAEQFGKSFSTAARWVRECRKRGLL